VVPKNPLMRTATVAAGVLLVALIGGGIGAYMVTRGAKPPAEPAAPPRGATPAESSKAAAEAEKLRAEKLAAEKDAMETAAAEKAIADKAAAERAAAEKLAAERAAQRIAAEKAAAEQAAERARAEQAARAKVAADKAAAERTARARAQEMRAAEKTEAERQLVAGAKTAVAVQVSPAPPSGDAAAFTYYTGLAHRGDARAALTLGELYESGRGVGASNNWAYLWYSVAERRGAAGAKPKKDAVATKLQPKEIEQLERQVRGVSDAPK